MEPIHKSNPHPISSRPDEIQRTGNLVGRRYSVSNYKPHEKLFLDNFARMLYEVKSQPFAFKGKVLSVEEVQNVPSPVKKEEKPIIYRRLTPEQVDEKAHHIKEQLSKFNKGFPEEDFVQRMLNIFFKSETEQQFIQTTLSLSDLPKDEVLQQLFSYCVHNRELLDDLKKEYKDYQKNFQSSLRNAIQLHEEFLKVYAHEGPAYDSANGLVVLSHNQLEFAKSLANKYFSQILDLNWTPDLELQNASLIQAIVVGDNILNKADNTVFLPKSTTCFILKETQGKVLPGTLKQLNPGISFSFNQFINFKNTTGIDEPATKETIYPIERLKDLFKSVMHVFTNDSLRRTGMHLISGNTQLALGTSLENRPQLATVLYDQFIEHLKNNPNELPKMINEMVNSPLLKSLSEAFPEYFTENPVLSQSVFPREAYLQLLQNEINKNHTEKMEPHQLRIEKELIALQKVTEITQETLNELKIRPDDAMEEKRLLPDLQALIQHKFLEVFILTNQSFFAPMIAPLTVQLFSETTPFFPNPTSKEYEFRNGLSSYAASLICNIVTPSTSDPNGVYDRFNDRPIVGQITIQTTASSISGQEHTLKTLPMNNILKDLRVGWKAPKSVVETLLSKIVPDAKPEQVSNGEELLKNVYFKQLEQLAQLKPGDDLVIDDSGVQIYQMNVNKVRPYTNILLNKLPIAVSGTITHYSGYSNENQYNPKAAEQLEQFTANLDKAIKLYVEQAITQGKDYNEINDVIIEQVSTKLARVHIALKDWGLVDPLISQTGKYYQMVNEMASFYLVPTNISD